MEWFIIRLYMYSMLPTSNVSWQRYHIEYEYEDYGKVRWRVLVGGRRDPLNPEVHFPYLHSPHS